MNILSFGPIDTNHQTKQPSFRPIPFKQAVANQMFSQRNDSTNAAPSQQNTTLSDENDFHFSSTGVLDDISSPLPSSFVHHHETYTAHTDSLSDIDLNFIETNSSTLLSNMRSSSSSSTGITGLSLSDSHHKEPIPQSDSSTNQSDYPDYSWNNNFLQLQQSLNDFAQELTYAENTLRHYRERALITESSYCLVFTPFRKDLRIKLQKKLNL